MARRPWTKLMADDIFVALLTSRFRMEEIHVNADYDFHGTYTKVKKERKKERKNYVPILQVYDLLYYNTCNYKNPN